MTERNVSDLIGIARKTVVAQKRLTYLVLTNMHNEKIFKQIAYCSTR